MPPVSEIAQRIKELKSAHTIEAPPQRTGNRHAEAEEPVTARIRRQAEATAASGAAMDPDDATAPASISPPPESLAITEPSTPDLSIPRATTHLERAASSRRQERQPILS